MTIKVVELFAGVGGFRLGLEGSSNEFETVWANQWEPGRTSQHAYECYKAHFGNCVNSDIAEVKDQVPKHDLLVGGFPCQDYSVARTGAKGIDGKKGALWWHIVDIAEQKRPKYILLENVDRLLKSPVSQRGRDFGIILRGLTELDYTIEWRVINAAEYGCAQRRRRTFIFAVHNSTSHYKKILNTNKFDVLTESGFFASEFKVNKSIISENEMSICDISSRCFKSLFDVSDNFEMKFNNTGICIEGKIYTIETTPINQKPITLNDICIKTKVDERFFLNGSLEKWEYLKGSKRVPRVKPNGEEYFYSEGSMAFPDNMSLPSRTMLTSESSLNRSTHVITDCHTGSLRLLTPIECERLNGFPDDWTNTGMPEKFRYFVMGNALVVPLIARMGARLLRLENDEKVKYIRANEKIKACV